MRRLLCILLGLLLLLLLLRQEQCSVSLLHRNRIRSLLLSRCFLLHACFKSLSLRLHRGNLCLLPCLQLSCLLIDELNLSCCCCCCLLLLLHQKSLLCWSDSVALNRRWLIRLLRWCIETHAQTRKLSTTLRCIHPLLRRCRLKTGHLAHR